MYIHHTQSRQPIISHNGPIQGLDRLNKLNDHSILQVVVKIVTPILLLQPQKDKNILKDRLNLSTQRVQWFCVIFPHLIPCSCFINNIYGEMFPYRFSISFVMQIN